jgi:hypothetical protein
MEHRFPDPTQIPLAAIPQVLAQLAALQSALIARMLLQRNENETANGDKGEDELLTVEQAAELLTVKPDWLYRRATHLPFTRRLSRKGLRFSRRGLISWRDRRTS